MKTSENFSPALRRFIQAPDTTAGPVAGNVKKKRKRRLILGRGCREATASTPYKCYECKGTFDSSLALRSHQQREHAGMTSDDCTNHNAAAEREAPSPVSALSALFSKQISVSEPPPVPRW